VNEAIEMQYCAMLYIPMISARKIAFMQTSSLKAIQRGCTVILSCDLSLANFSRSVSLSYSGNSKLNYQQQGVYTLIEEGSG
jgi:hypothetical protein